jgi:hypothetical protein
LANGSLATVSWYLIERACFLGDLGLQEIADEALRLMLALDGHGQRLAVGAPHPIQLEAAHHVEDFGSLHVMRS